MKVNEYVNNLTQLLKKNPEIAELEVIYSQDAEGNSYQKVFYSPSIMNTEGLENAYVTGVMNINPDEIDVETSALCIN